MSKKEKLTIGDMKLLEVNEYIIGVYPKKFVDIDFQYVDGKLKVDGLRKAGSKRKEFVIFVNIDVIEDLTPKQFHYYLLEIT